MNLRTNKESEHLLIDGYNLIKADPLLRQHEQVSLLAARQALELSLRRYARRTGVRIGVFYDGNRNTAQEPDSGGDMLWIRFSRAPDTADDMIKRFVQERHGARYLRVITSDREIRRFVRRHKIASTPAQEFAEELESAPQSLPPAAPAPPPELDPELELNAEEVDFWEQWFRNHRRSNGGSA